MTDARTDESATESTTRRLRKALGLTQTQLAAQVGCSQQNVGDIESGKSLPSLKLALAIAGALGSTVDELFAHGVDA